MRKAFFSIFAVFVLLIAACNSKSEKTSETSTDKNYLELEVGVNKGGLFTITNLNVIKEAWQERISGEGSDIVLKNFKVVQGLTTGDSTQTYYMLVANSADGKTKAASLLNLKGNSFYFDVQQDQDGALFYLNIICEGTCNEGCDPIVTLSNGVKYINCSQCADCVKKGAEMR